jgi:hypothetical protein
MSLNHPPKGGRGFFPPLPQKTVDTPGRLPIIPLSPHHCGGEERVPATESDPNTVFDNSQREIPYGSEKSLAPIFGESLWLGGGRSLRERWPGSPGRLIVDDE